MKAHPLIELDGGKVAMVDRKRQPAGALSRCPGKGMRHQTLSITQPARAFSYPQVRKVPAARIFHFRKHHDADRTSAQLHQPPVVTIAPAMRSVAGDDFRTAPDAA